jgi:hypothetical protein
VPDVLRVALAPANVDQDPVAFPDTVALANGDEDEDPIVLSHADEDAVAFPDSVALEDADADRVVLTHADEDAVVFPDTDAVVLTDCDGVAALRSLPGTFPVKTGAHDRHFWRFSSRKLDRSPPRYGSTRCFIPLAQFSRGWGDWPGGCLSPIAFDRQLHAVRYFCLEGKQHSFPVGSLPTDVLSSPLL